MIHKKSRRALGRGLSILIPVDSEEKGSDDNVVYIDIDLIEENPFQPRKDFDNSEIRSLADSIKSQGLLQPIILRKKGGRYEMISGERRLRALKLIGEDKIPSIVKPKVSDREMLEMALVENIQREDLNDIEMALSYQRLILECGLSHKQLSEHIGKSRAAVTNTIRLLKLPEKIQTILRAGKITTGHARALLALENTQEQYNLAEKICSNNMSVRDVENEVWARINKKRKRKKGNRETLVSKSGKDPEIESQEEKLRYRFGTDVKINMKSSCKGKIEIYYYSRDDLNRLLNIIGA